jgi:hypothetical protein
MLTQVNDEAIYQFHHTDVHVGSIRTGHIGYRVSNPELIGYRTYQIPNLSDTKLIRYRTHQISTFQISKFSDTEFMRYQTYQTPNVSDISWEDGEERISLQVALRGLEVILSWEGERGLGLTCLVPNLGAKHARRGWLSS